MAPCRGYGGGSEVDVALDVDFGRRAQGLAIVNRGDELDADGGGGGAADSEDDRA